MYHVCLMQSASHWGREVSTLVDTCIMYVSCMYHLPSKLPEMIHRWYIHDTCINRWYTMIQHDTRWYTRRSVSSLIQRWYRDDTRWYTRIGNDHESDRKEPFFPSHGCRLMRFSAYDALVVFQEEVSPDVLAKRRHLLLAKLKRARSSRRPRG